MKYFSGLVLATACCLYGFGGFSFVTAEDAKSFLAEGGVSLCNSTDHDSVQCVPISGTSATKFSCGKWDAAKRIAGHVVDEDSSVANVCTNNNCHNRLNVHEYLSGPFSGCLDNGIADETLGTEDDWPDSFPMP